MADEEIDVTVEEETATDETVITKVEGEKTDAKTETKEPVADLAAQFKELEAQAEKDREARLAAERRYRAALTERDRATREAQTAREDAADREADSIAAGIAAAQTEASAAETEYKAAFEAGDAGAMAAAQRKLARAEAKSVRLDEAKAELEARAARRTAEQTTTDKPASQPSADPVEAYIQGRTEPTANWLRSHKEWITDPRKNAKLTAAHHNAMADGLVPDSDEYFSHVETFIGLRKSADETTKTNGAAKPRRQTPAVAPVQASGGGTGGSGGNEVKLTQSEAQAAKDGTLTWNYDDPSPQKKFKKGDPIGVQEFARRKLAMTKQGLYDKSYTEA